MYLNGCDNMGFFGFGKKQKMVKLVGKYVNQRLKHKRSFKNQLERLDAQLQHEEIDQLERDRLRDLLEANYYQQQQEDWKRIQNKYINPLIS
jgi:hypothetical protein